MDFLACGHIRDSREKLPCLQPRVLRDVRIGSRLGFIEPADLMLRSGQRDLIRRHRQKYMINMDMMFGSMAVGPRAQLNGPPWSADCLVREPGGDGQAGSGQGSFAASVDTEFQV